MIWKTKTHTFSATVCQVTGQPCPALARMARGLTRAMATAHPVTHETFQVEGSSELTHCADGCTARFRANPDEVRIFCGATADAEIETLDVYADMMFGDDCTGLPSIRAATPPCAMIEALTLTSEIADQQFEGAHA